MDLLSRGRTRVEFERFVSDHGKQLLRTGYLITWDILEAEDLVQECLLRVARRWPKVRAMAHPHAYAQRVLVNLAFDESPKRARRRHELAEHHSPAFERPDAARSFAGSAQIEARDELREILAALPKRQRAMVVLRYFADLSEAQTAQALDCSVGTVKSTTSRAIERLRTVITTEAEPAPTADDEGGTGS
ncbi:MAG TPA: SigE family RNA polymerase sigma factor [Solirubrobacteraceae bacterium]|nr:SigE family RNA polymerase sigma factor [Solirubrobacteraceae bacterium]